MCGGGGSCYSRRFVCGCSAVVVYYVQSYIGKLYILKYVRIAHQ